VPCAFPVTHGDSIHQTLRLTKSSRTAQGEERPGVAGTLTGIEIEVQRVVNGLVSLELDERVAAFDAAVDALNGQIQRWSEYGARLRAGDVVPGSDGRTRSDINIEVVFD